MRRGRRARDAAARPRPARRGDRAARRAAERSPPSARAGSSMPATSASRSATPTGRSSSTATRAPPIRRNHARGRRARRALLETATAISASSCRSSTSCAAPPTIRRGCATTCSSAARSRPQLGDQTGARVALSRAVDLDPDDSRRRRELADMLYAAQHWAKARPLLRGPARRRGPAARGRRARAPLPRRALARRSSATSRRRRSTSASRSRSLPDHRDALLLRAELAGRPIRLAATSSPLANLAPPEERATRFAALGDRYSELGDRAAAREMYREAIVVPARRSPAAHEVPRARRRRRRLVLQPRRRRQADRDREGSARARPLPPPRRP